MAVLVLQALAVQRRAPGGAAEQEAAAAHVARGPREIADALQSEHRVVDVERDHRQVVGAVRRRRRDPRAHRARLVDAFLQHLARLVLAVVHQLIGVLRLVELPHRRVDAELPEHPFHAERARFVGNDRHDVLADRLVAHQRAQHLHERHRRRDLALVAALQQPLEVGERRRRQRGRLAPPLRQIAAQRRAALLQILRLRTVLGQRDERHRGDLVVRHRNVEAVAELLQRILRHLLRLVRDHLPFAGLAHAVTLDRLGQDHRRLALVLHRGRVRRVDLERIVAAAASASTLRRRTGPRPAPSTPAC